MIDSKKYKLVHSHESAGSLGDIGLQIFVAIERTLSETEVNRIRHKADEIYNSILQETYRSDPKTIAAKEEQRTGLLSVFDGYLIYAKEIPNEYDSHYGFPWFLVTTQKGPIKIGWRKRVIIIDWSQCEYAASSETLFTGEAVTKDEYSIHAWGYEKAKEYIQTIMSRGFHVKKQE